MKTTHELPTHGVARGARRRRGAALGMFIRLVLLAGVIAAVLFFIRARGAERDVRPDAVTLRFWNGFTGPDGRTMLNIVQKFNQQNPDVHVLMQRTEWATYYNKLFVAGLGNRSPEIFVIQAHYLARFQRAGLLRPIDDMVADGRIPVSDIFPNVWKISQFDGHTVGLPLDMFIMGQYYNRKMLVDAGIVDDQGKARPPETKDEFLDMLRKIKRHNPEQWGFVFANLQTNGYSVMRQFGGPMFSDDGKTCTLNDPRNVAALEFCRQLIRENLVPSPELTDAWVGFQQGKVATAWEGIYMLDDLRRTQNPDFMGAPVPTLGTQPAMWAGSHVLCLRPDLTGKELQVAERFILFLSNNSLDWAQGGQIPARRSLETSQRFADMTVQSAFAKQIADVQYDPRVPFINEFETELTHAIEVALRGTKSAKDALDDATRSVNDVMQRDRQLNPEGNHD